MRRALVVLLSVAACYTGPTAEKFGPARSPRGIAADLRLVHRTGRIRGELLAVEDTALLVLRDQRVVLVPLRAIALGGFRQRGPMIERGRISDQHREALRRVSRYPGGLPEPVRTRLLQAHGQSTPDAP